MEDWRATRKHTKETTDLRFRTNKWKTSSTNEESFQGGATKRKM